MAGLVPAIHVFVSEQPKQDVDHRDKPGDDEKTVLPIQKNEQHNE
jgi:hypothetical protein